MRMMTIATYYLLADPEKGNRVREELGASGLMAGYPAAAPRWADLEKLPYLAACVKESLRLGIGATRHAAKYFPNDDIRYKEWVIPRGVSSKFFSLSLSVFQVSFGQKKEGKK